MSIILEEIDRTLDDIEILKREIHRLNIQWAISRDMKKMDLIIADIRGKYKKLALLKASLLV